MPDSYPSILTYICWGLSAALLAFGALLFTPIGREARKQREEFTQSLTACVVFAGLLFGLGFLLQGSHSKDAVREANRAVAVAQANFDRANQDYLAITAGTATQSTSQSMSFDRCIQRIQRASGELNSAGENIVENHDARIVRFRTADGSVLVTCSRPDRKMVITRSPGR